MNNTLIFIPTYNESENIEPIYKQIKTLALKADILFVDDGSPDGTGRIADRLCVDDACVFVAHRSGKLGIGSAHQEGIAWAYNKGYKTLITMDCDFTHQPADIRVFIENSTSHDIVIGSRYINKENPKDWNLFRKTLTF